MVEVTFKTKSEMEALLGPMTDTDDARVFKGTSEGQDCFFTGVNGLPKQRQWYYQYWYTPEDEADIFIKMVAAADQMQTTGTWPEWPTA